ncbi:MAG: NAD(P)-dependent oxidoreductase [Syntrophaceae bacterium]|nr:NAD(P)-dependent oxidoreductase [Syntrophaceae bacterium]
MKISILGARGQIARSLISLYAEKGELSNLVLYSREPERLRLEIKDAVVYSSEDFPRHNHDVIINCIGIPTVKGVPNRASDVFDIHERWDNLILEYLKRNEKALYISMSSGAVYGRNFQNPVDETSCLLQGITEISPADFYGVSKLNCEAKHRAHEKFSIVDLRIFSYISRFIDFNSNFLVSEILMALRNKKIFMTNDHNIARDYLHPEDMMQILSLIIKRWQKTGFINDVFDVYSKKPITKMDLLESLAKKFNLQYEIKKELHVDASATGFKMNYYSVNKKLEKIGYEPRYSSLNAILKVFGEVL